ncbi:MAG: hypothetical protein IPL52_04555 [Flavobacteriales bacterium]|nr:hypothetical protein [Flavobacteriales bacterium]
MRTLRIQVVISLFGPFMCLSQTTSHPFPRGAYLTIDELRARTPSVPFQFNILRRTKGDIVMNGGNDYKVEATNDTLKKKFFVREIYAISTGDTLFLNCFVLELQKWYATAYLSGDSLVFDAGIPMNQDIGPGPMFGAMGGAIGGAQAAKVRYRYSLDLNTGKVACIARMPNL